MENGTGESTSYMMQSLMESAHTPTTYLMIAGVIMVLALIMSKKAQNVVKTSVDLSRQDEGDEMFGSSAAARIIVRTTQKIATGIDYLIPQRLASWINSRFNSNQAVLPEGAAFDQIRAAVNLVLAGLLVAFGTSLKLPLSTTYVTFMVAMGSSLADRAWSRESAVFRITGVMSVIGGWFITAGAAFIMCFLITNLLLFGSFPAMIIAVLVAIVLLVRSNLKYKDNKETNETDLLFRQLNRTQDKCERWQLLKMHVSHSTVSQLNFVNDSFQKITSAFLHEDYTPLRQSTHEIETARKQLKRQRRREIIGLRKIEPILAMERNTWYFLNNSNVEQMIYCLKRINDPCREHIGNNFQPTSAELANDFYGFQQQMQDIFRRSELLLTPSTIDADKIMELRTKAEGLQRQMAGHRQQVIDTMQKQSVNIESTIVYLNIVQESQQMLSCLRHTLRGISKFCA